MQSDMKTDFLASGVVWFFKYVWRDPCSIYSITTWAGRTTTGDMSVSGLVEPESWSYDGTHSQVLAQAKTRQEDMLGY